jgi:hypothetical protein
MGATMIDKVPLLFSSKIIIGGPGGIVLNFPSIEGIFSGGVLSAIAFFLSMVFTLLIVIWIGYSIYGAYKIIASGGGEELQKGMTIIKNIWLSITFGLGFFIVLSAIGTFVGVGSIYDWTKSVAQCHDGTGGFYFMDYELQSTVFTSNDIAFHKDRVYCCEVKENITPPTDHMPGAYERTGLFKGYHYVISVNGSSPDIEASQFFSDCILYDP